MVWYYYYYSAKVTRILSVTHDFYRAAMVMDLQLPMQSVPITTYVVRSNHAQARCEQNAEI
jgi:hypothetical protein